MSVKKFSLFDPGETGRVRKILAKRIRFLAFYPSAAAFFVYFFLLKKKSKSPSGWRTVSSNDLERISFTSGISCDPFLDQNTMRLNVNFN